jgi:hypothetical protein
VLAYMGLNHFAMALPEFSLHNMIDVYTSVCNDPCIDMNDEFRTPTKKCYLGDIFLYLNFHTLKICSCD